MAGLERGTVVGVDSAPNSKGRVVDSKRRGRRVLLGTSSAVVLSEILTPVGFSAEEKVEDVSESKSKERIDKNKEF